MKIFTKITIGLATATLLLVGCSGTNTQTNADVKENVKPIIDESHLGYRGTTDLLKEDVIPPAVQYHSAAPGTSKKFKRAYQDAPPMIPHDTTGMLPIEKDNNQCLMCHMPDMAASMGATPIPVSHFTDFRPKTTIKDGEILKNGKVIVNTSSEKLENVSIKSTHGELYQGRFNCTQCHAPQAINTLVDQNKFKPVYVDSDGDTKSSWDKSKWLKDINTQKK
jgi:cytochrome c-type protein NapB